MSNSIPIKVAVLDLYDGEPNQGMRALRELLTACDRCFYDQPVEYHVYEARNKDEVPGLGYDLYISSGGPGSPFDGEGKTWENKYFHWLDSLWNHNERCGPGFEMDRKHALFICHSYQMMARFFELAEVTKRGSASFGVFPVYQTKAGAQDPMFAPMEDPFYAADFRAWQVVQPDAARLAAFSAEVLALEKPRPRVDRERATMAIRLSPELLGVQFHPEADPEGMLDHFGKPERMRAIVDAHGEDKYWRTMRRLCDPDYLEKTYEFFIPTLVRRATEILRPELVEGKAA